jgi:aminopeptidase
MRDPRLDKLADVLVRYSTAVKPGDLVAILCDPVAMPLVEATTEAIIKAGGHPLWVPRAESLSEILLTHGTEEQLRYLSPIQMHMVETIDVQIAIWAEVNTKYTGRMDPARVAMHQASRRPYTKRFMERVGEGSLRWVGTQYPTHAAAQDAEMSLRQYADFVYRAGYLHLDDPAAMWRRIEEQQERVREYLQSKRVLRFRAPPRDGDDGTDLTVDVSGGTWINCAGRENFPDGEVFAGPQGADGHVNYHYPAVYQGREVEGVRLKFKAGRVVDASAKKNEEFLIKMLDQDEGARNMGEIAIGTNYEIREFSRNTLFDEKIGGTFHAAVGAGYPESGNRNLSGLHWDMVCDLRRGGSIEADGEVFHRDGKFLREGWPGN